ncbi:MAG: manganese efflux pump MntP family protein [Planctomycetes bacterium]|jgi:putative Mn2+ efflux pump MntP|nr:manganese efflux pump MntP family protein [Planctomycetota bacterium]
MPFVEVVLLALALAVDAFSVGAAVGLEHRSPRQIFRLSWHFGLFQALMPLCGILIGFGLERWIRTVDHWVAFGLLVLVGGRMVREGFRSGETEDADRDPTRGLSLITLSVAVSIDALAVGFTLGITGADFVLPVCVIGVVAALATLASMLLAGRIGRILGRRAGVVAGLVLIGIGVKILVEHLAGA